MSNLPSALIPMEATGVFVTARQTWMKHSPACWVSQLSSTVSQHCVQTLTLSSAEVTLGGEEACTDIVEGHGQKDKKG